MSLEIMTGRMIEQAQPWTPWSRRAWEPGTLLQLRELVEVLEWVEHGALSKAAANWFRTNLRPMIALDAGLADGEIRRQLNELLSVKLTHGSPQQRRLSVLVEYLEGRYLQTWRDVLASGNPFNVERASRFIVGHVIDCGFDPRWVQAQVRAQVNASVPAADVVESLVSMVQEPAYEFKGIVPLVEVPEIRLVQALGNWLGPRDTNAILTASGCSPRRGQGGALEFVITARDPKSAARDVFQRLENLAARTQFLRRSGTFRYETYWHVTEGPSAGKRLKLEPSTSLVSATSLIKTGHLYSGSSSAALDDAFQLASAMKTGQDSIAVSGGWAALEALLTTPSDWSELGSPGRSNVADRAASIVAAAWPRAELTTLSYKLQRLKTAPPLLKAQLVAAGTNNVQRCKHVLDAIGGGTIGATLDPLIDAAVLRMEMLSSDPKRTLRRVEGYMKSSFRRLYRQRNVVLHGGSARSLALAATMRTATPLVGAVLDRLSHGIEVAGREPLDVAARSRAALDAAGDPHSWPIYELSPDDS